MDVQKSDRFFVITGGPGSGKSALVEALRSVGICGMPEAGRAIIQDQVAIGGHALPWGDRAAFAELMLNWELRSYREALGMTGPVIFDRGVPDVIGYLRLSRLPVASHVEKAVQVFRYNRCVFIAPPWREIFGQDAERKQSFEEAVATYEALAETYSAFDYEMIHLPLASVEERARFVRERIGLAI